MNIQIRFVELMKSLERITPRSLTEVLQDLTNLGILEKRSYREIPPRVGYRLTSLGAELRDAVSPLLEWASRLRPQSDCPILNAIRATKG